MHFLGYPMRGQFSVEFVIDLSFVIGRENYVLDVNP